MTTLSKQQIKEPSLQQINGQWTLVLDINDKPKKKNPAYATWVEQAFLEDFVSLNCQTQNGEGLFAIYGYEFYEGDRVVLGLGSPVHEHGGKYKHRNNHVMAALSLIESVAQECKAVVEVLVSRRGNGFEVVWVDVHFASLWNHTMLGVPYPHRFLMLQGLFNDFCGVFQNAMFLWRRCDVSLRCVSWLRFKSKSDVQAACASMRANTTNPAGLVVYCDYDDIEDTSRMFRKSISYVVYTGGEYHKRGHRQVKMFQDPNQPTPFPCSDYADSIYTKLSRLPTAMPDSWELFARALTEGLAAKTAQITQ